MVNPRHHDGDITRVIAWCRFLLFIGRFMLFVHNDKTQVVEGKKDRGTDTDHKLDLSTKYTIPDFNALVVGKTGMVNPHAVAEYLLQSLDNLRGQRNFRQQVEGLRIAFDGFLDQVDVDLCLA